MSFGSPSYDPPAQQAPVVAATPPDPEQVATAPDLSKDAQMKNDTNAKRKGTSALRIQLNVGGMTGGGGGGGGNAAPRGGGGNGLSI